MGHQRGLPDLVQPGGTGQALLPTPTATPYGSNRSRSPGATRRPGLHALAGLLLPTPTAADSRASANATAGRAVPATRHTGHTLTDAARLLPTPRSSDGAKGSPGQRGSHGDLTLSSAAVSITAAAPTGTGTRHVALAARWGAYTAAVARWERLLGRPVPEPTQPGRHGKPVLAPAFVEWLMGLPEHWVTDPRLALPRTRALRLLGNGVLPQQATAALRVLLCPHWRHSSR